MAVRKFRSVVWCTLLLTSGACALVPARPVCRMGVDTLVAGDQRTPENFDPAVWSALLLDGAEHDCRGNELLQKGKRYRALRPMQLVLNQHRGETWLVWLKTHRADDGTAVGPVAEVRVGRRALKAMAVGALEAPERGMALTLRKTKGGTVLQATSKRCGPSAAEGTCQVESRILLRERGMFHAAPNSLVALRRYEAAAHKRQARRIYTLETDLTPHGKAPLTYTLQERLVITEAPQPGKAAPGRTLRRVESSRTLAFDGERWQTSTPSLWWRRHDL